MTAIIPLLLPILTVLKAMVVAGVDDIDFYDGHSSLARFTVILFEDDFTTYIDESHKDLEGDFNSFLVLTQMHLCPTNERRNKARERSNPPCILCSNDG